MFKIESVELYIDKDTGQEVVKSINWLCNSQAGNVPIERNDKEEFIDYEELKTETLVGWVKNYLGEKKVKEIEEWKPDEEKAKDSDETVFVPWSK